MPVVARLTQRVIDRAPFAQRNPYYIMEGGTPQSLRGFGVRVHRSQKEFVVRFRRKPYSLGRADLLQLPTARVRARKLLLELLQGKVPVASTHTVKELSEAYMRRHARPHKAPRSVEEDARMWRLHVLPILGTRLVHEISTEDIQDLHVGMRGKPFAANRVLALLSKAFGLAELWRWREHGTSPTKGIQKYPEPSRRRQLTSEEYRCLGAALLRARRERILPTLSLAAVELLLYTGCRPGELLAVEWAWIDLDRRVVRLPRAKGDRHHSKRRGREIWLNAPAVQVIHRFQPAPGNPYLLPSTRTGSHIKNIKKTWHGLCRLAGIQRAPLYTLRHSFVSEGVPAGVPLELVSDLAGHGDVETTDRVYRARRDDAQRSAAESMGQHLHHLTYGSGPRDGARA